MKTNVTRKVIVIITNDNQYLFGMSKSCIVVDFTENIKYADEFETHKDAELSLSYFNKIYPQYCAKIKEYTYNIDRSFLGNATNIKAL